MGIDKAEDEEDIQDEEDQVKIKKQVRISSDPQLDLFPLFLKKMNSTYFKAVNASFLQSSLIKQLKSCSDADNNIIQKSHSILVTEKEKKNYFSNISEEQKPQNNDKNSLQLLNKSNQKGLQQIVDISQRDTTSNRSNELFSNRIENQQKTAQEGFSITYQKIQKDINKRQQQEMLKLIEENQENLYQNKSVDFGKILAMPDLNNSQIQNDFQNQRIQACLICVDNKPNAVNMPCGHGGICNVCAVKILEQTGECYLCRHPIEQVLELEVQVKNKNEKKIIKVLQSARLETCEINTEQEMDQQILNQNE